MKLGAMSSMYSYAGVPAEQILERFAKYDLKYVDMMTIGDLQVNSMNREKIERIKNKNKQLGLTPSCLIASVGGNGASSDPEVRNRTAEAVGRAMRAASEMGFLMVLLFLGEKEPGTAPRQSWDCMKLFVDRCLQDAEREKIVLTFESNPRIYRMVNSLEEASRLLREIPSPFFKATLDMGHLTVCREAPSQILQLKGQIIHAHITDNDGTADTNETLGTGFTPIAECLAMIDAAGIDETARRCDLEPVAVIELGSPEKISLRSVDRVLERSLDHLRKIDSPYLRQV